MKLTIYYFGQLAEKTSCTKEDLVLSEAISVLALKKILHEKHPVLDEMNYRIAADQVLVDDNYVLSKNIEIALLPPFSGG